MEISLKPCPFCGGEARFASNMTGSDYWVLCRKCGAIQPVFTNRNHTEQEAAEAWNTRTPPSDWREARELLDKTFQPDSGNLTAAYLVGLADGKAEARGTCRNVTKDATGQYEPFKCSECGEGFPYEVGVPLFCPNCGAEVVD
ncbi:MAG: Lar family restriction alleviation protein [Kiritimatiellae bacterium]|nr:Lar family restriction alleviation protein [Kiritimatiellia bacterium]